MDLEHGHAGGSQRSTSRDGAATRLRAALHVAIAACVLVAAAVVALAPSARQAASSLDGRVAQAPGLPPPYTAVAEWPLPPADTLPVDAALGPDDSLFVLDAANREVHVYAITGTLRSRWPAPEVADTPGADLVPTQLAFDVIRERVYVVWQAWAGASTRGSLYFESRRTDGTPLHAPIALPGSELRALAVHSASGDLYVATDGRVGRLTPDNPRVIATLPITYVVGREVAIALAGDRIGIVREGTTPLQRELLFTDLDGSRIVEPPVDIRPHVAVGVDVVGDEFRVLVAGSDTMPADAPAVLGISRDGAVTGALTVSQLGIMPPDAWVRPGAFATSARATAFLTQVPGQRWAVHVWRDGRAPITIAFALRDPLYGRMNVPPPEQRRRLALDAAPDGSLVLFDAVTVYHVTVATSSSRIARFAADGGLVAMRVGPPRAIDVASDADGALYVSEDEYRIGDAGGSTRVMEPSRVLRLGVAEHLAPTWSTDCACEVGGQLDAGPSAIYVTRPLSHAIAALDPSTGAVVGGVAPSAASGAWPTDLAVAPDGRLWTADLGSGRVERWSAPGQPDLVWQCGARAGPRKLTVGTWPDGTTIVAAVMSDGMLEVHAAETGNLLARWAPSHLDGSRIDPSDVALASNGRLYVADLARNSVVVLDPVEGPVPTPGEPPPTPTPSAYSCAVSGDKVAGPRVVVLGGTAAVTLSLSARCPERGDLVGADILLAPYFGLRASRMTGEPARDMVHPFAALVDYRLHRVAAILHRNERRGPDPVVERFEFGTDPHALVAWLRERQIGGDPNLARLIQDAAAMHLDTGRPNALRVLVLFYYGSGRLGQADVQAADAARAAGIQVFVVSDRSDPFLTGVAGSAARVFVNPRPADLYPIYGEILRQAGLSLAGDLIVDDEMADHIAYESGSSWPPAAELRLPDRLRWGQSLLPASGMTLTYVIRPRTTGRLPTNRRAVAHYTDYGGEARKYEFPVPEILVVAPSPTPSPTATPTPRPPRIFLPVALREGCTKRTIHADVALVIDTSTSMRGPALEGGTKLAAAQAAARAFLEQMAFAADGQGGRDQVAIAWFNDAARIEQALSSDGAALRSAIDRLPSRTAEGTRLDSAIEIGRSAVLGVRHVGGNTPAIVLLTDGLPNRVPTAPPSGSQEATVIAAAARAKADGIRIYAIGLGRPDAVDASERINAGLLRAVASDPALYFETLSAAQLATIYSQIAYAIGCPPESYWGRR